MITIYIYQQPTLFAVNVDSQAIVLLGTPYRKFRKQSAGFGRWSSVHGGLVNNQEYVWG
jgi:hypothetical protein